MNAREAQFDIEALFRTHYRRVARMIARVVRDPARVDELAVEVFLKLWRNSNAPGDHAEGWLYRVALRAGLVPAVRQPSAAVRECWARVWSAPSSQRQAEFLVLRSHGFSYDELALTLSINPSSVGTLLSRAQQSFRKEFIKRYGQE
jgi:DNA-directed RNA polymerase specialized sigma24 family protein